MAKISGIQTINDPSTGQIQTLVIDVNKALKNEQMAAIVEDLLDHMQIVKAKRTATLVSWDDAKERLNKKFDLK